MDFHGFSGAARVVGRESIGNCAETYPFLHLVKYVFSSVKSAVIGQRPDQRMVANAVTSEDCGAVAGSDDRLSGDVWQWVCG